MLEPGFIHACCNTSLQVGRMKSTSVHQEMRVAFGQPRNDYRGNKLGSWQEEEKTILRQGFQSGLFIESTLNYPWSDYLYQKCRNKSAPAGFISLGAAQCKCSHTSRDSVGPENMQRLFFSIRLKSFFYVKWSLSPYHISKSKSIGENGKDSR